MGYLCDLQLAPVPILGRLSKVGFGLCEAGVDYASIVSCKFSSSRAHEVLCMPTLGVDKVVRTTKVSKVNLMFVRVVDDIVVATTQTFSQTSIRCCTLTSLVGVEIHTALDSAFIKGVIALAGH